MKIRILCLALCSAIMLCATACKSVDDTNSSSLPSSTTTSTSSTSSTSSTTSTSSDTDINSDVQSTETKPEDTSSESSSTNSSLPTNTSSNASTNSTVSEENTVSEDKSIIEMLYGFSSIKKVNYYCVRNLPGSDIIYSVSSIITNTNTDIVSDSSLKLLCDDKNVKIDNTVITIPSSYAKSNKSIKLTAYHSAVDTKFDFTIKPNVKWNLIFEDNFDSAEINTDVWNIWDQKRDWRYSYSKDNMILDGNGNLINRMSVLKKPDAVTGETQISGAMTTQGKFETTYGYFEVRMIPHRAEGLMGAFWLMCGDMGDKDAADDGTAKNGCEVDIIETFYHRKDPSHTIHWDGYTHTKSYHFNNSGRDDIFDGNYHTFAFRWSPTEYAFLIDGVVTGKTNKVDICDQPGYLLISSHFNTNAGTLPIGAGEYTDMIVDYVKVYSSSDDIK